MTRGARIYGHVWWCGDEVCDCTQAQIVRTVPHPNNPRVVIPTVIWSGTFRTDSMPGANNELNRTAQWLRRHHHDVYEQIEWPWTGK